MKSVSVCRRKMKKLYVVSKAELSKHLYCLTANFTEKCMHTKNLTLSHGNLSRSHTMSLNKSITHGKEHRRPCRGAKAIAKSCRNHGDCEWSRWNLYVVGNVFDDLGVLE